MNLISPSTQPQMQCSSCCEEWVAFTRAHKHWCPTPPHPIGKHPKCARNHMAAYKPCTNYNPRKHNCQRPGWLVGLSLYPFRVCFDNFWPHLRDPIAIADLRKEFDYLKWSLAAAMLSLVPRCHAPFKVTTQEICDMSLCLFRSARGLQHPNISKARQGMVNHLSFFMWGVFYSFLLNPRWLMVLGLC